MAADPHPYPLPDRPISIDEVIERIPAVRASLLASYDLCPLTTLFSMRHGYRLSGPEAAVGTMAHRVYAEIARTLRKAKEEVIPVAEALEILYECMKQEGVPEWDRVHIPRRYLPHLRMVVVKFAKDYRFSWELIVAVEETLRVKVPYEFPDGRMETRVFTGTPDLVLFAPPNGAIILDWKTGWALPPKPRVARGEDLGAWGAEKEAQRLSVEGYVQQRQYAYLLMMNYRKVEFVTLREAYTARGEIREATIYRSDLEHVEREIATQLQDLDRAIAAGPKFAGTGKPKDPFVAMPGPACQYCLMPNRCPIEADARRGGAVTDSKRAALYAAEYQVALAVINHHRPALRAWLENQVVPWIELRWSKRRRAIGFNIKPDGSSRFEVFTPEGSDFAPKPDPQLEEAFLASATEGAQQKARRKRRRVLDR